MLLPAQPQAQVVAAIVGGAVIVPLLPHRQPITAAIVQASSISRGCWLRQSSCHHSLPPDCYVLLCGAVIGDVHITEAADQGAALLDLALDHTRSGRGLLHLQQQQRASTGQHAHTYAGG